MYDAERKIFESFTPLERATAEEMNESGRQIERDVYGPRGNPELEHDHYALDENNVCVPVGLGTWAIWNAQQRRLPDGGRLRVGSDKWRTWSVGHVHVSTVFLGLDHGFGSGHRALFETMVFFTRWSLPRRIQRLIPWAWQHRLRLTRNDEFQCRYATYEQAKRGHARVVTMTRRYLNWKITRDELLRLRLRSDQRAAARAVRGNTWKRKS